MYFCLNYIRKIVSKIDRILFDYGVNYNNNQKKPKNL